MKRMEKRRLPAGILMFSAILLMAAAGCSSAPKGPVERHTQRRNAQAQLNAADRETDRGNYEYALVLISDAQRLAVSADDSALIIRVELSRGNILSCMGRDSEAGASFTAALNEAERIGNKELAAASRLHMTRVRLLAALATGDASAAAGEALAQAQAEIPALKTEQSAAALGWTVIGLAEKELNHWTEAERALKNALDIHIKGEYLELAAYDWYLIASLRSVSGQYTPALKALEEALAFDRRAENTYGLGMDWMGMGDIYKKAGNDIAAEIAYRRSADIFKSVNLEKEAAEAEGRIMKTIVVEE